MTMPSDRTRVLIQTRELPLELADDSTLTAFIRRLDRQLLRHYPNANEKPRAGQLR